MTDGVDGLKPPEIRRELTSGALDLTIVSEVRPGRSRPFLLLRPGPPAPRGTRFVDLAPQSIAWNRGQYPSFARARGPAVSPRRCHGSKGDWLVSVT